MVKNLGGNKTKGKSRKSVKKIRILNSEELKKIDGQEYAFINQNFGQGRCELICYDKVKRLGILRGRLKKNTKIEKGQLVLVSKREFQDDKCDILECYTPENVDKLISFGEIYSSFAKEGKLKDESQNSLDKILSFTENDTDSDSEDKSDKDSNQSDDDFTGINIDDI